MLRVNAYMFHTYLQIPKMKTIISHLFFLFHETQVNILPLLPAACCCDLISLIQCLCVHTFLEALLPLL